MEILEIGIWNLKVWFSLSENERRRQNLMEYPPPAKKPRLTDTEESNEYPPAASDNGVAWVCNTSTLQRYAKPKLGLNVDYYPYFFKKGDADAILQQLESELQPYLDSSKNQVKIMGKVCQIPRKQTAFGDAGLTYSFSGTTVPANAWNPLVHRIKGCLENALEEKFNFVLVNRYNDGSDHIGEHRDDETDLCPGASIASLSFGQERDFVFKHKDSRGKNATRKDIQPVKLSLRHGSLLAMRHPTNSVWYHSLPVRRNVPFPRINLTFRRMRETK